MLDSRSSWVQDVPVAGQVLRAKIQATEKNRLTSKYPSMANR